jgi:hypothetical protein
LKIGNTLGVGTALVQRLVMEQPGLSTSTSLRRRLPLNKKESPAGGP